MELGREEGTRQTDSSAAQQGGLSLAWVGSSEQPPACGWIRIAAFDTSFKRFLLGLIG